MLVHGLHQKIQSAYKSGHTTETVLLRLKKRHVDGYRWTEGCGSCSIRYISAAFDTVDHEIMCSRLDGLLRLGEKPLA